MLQLNKLRELNMRAATQPGRPPHLSAASGLIHAGKFLYAVGDDEQHLAIFAIDGDMPGEWLRLQSDALPLPKAERKARKPDFEVLVKLPPFASYAHGALLALGSGSKPQREAAVLLALDTQGAVAGTPRRIDLSSAYADLRKQLGEINIEGAVVTDQRMRLLQRGNSRHGRNATVEWNLPEVLQQLSGSDALTGLAPLAVTDYELGAVNGVRLCFSDGVTLPQGGWLFTAIAEDTDNSYADGQCLGAAVGYVRPDGQLAWVRQLEQPHKLEGIEAWVQGDVIQLLLVTDADDEKIPAALYSAVIPLSDLQNR